MNEEHPVRFSVDYPDRPPQPSDHRLPGLHGDPDRHSARQHRRLHERSGYDASTDAPTIVIGGKGLLFLAAVADDLFREKYPRWWFDWNLELLRHQPRRHLPRPHERPLPVDG